MFQHEVLELILPAVEPLLKDADRFKQRAGAEMLIGLLRGTWYTLVSSYSNMRCQARSIGQDNGAISCGNGSCPRYKLSITASGQTHCLSGMQHST